MKKNISLDDLSEDSVTLESERMPKYITKPPKFSCPLSPDILWHHDLSYNECPVGPDHRNMGTCATCKCRGDSNVKIKSRKRNKPKKKFIPKIEKRQKEPIPKIGKTYVSK